MELLNMKRFKMQNDLKLRFNYKKIQQTVDEEEHFGDQIGINIMDKKQINNEPKEPNNYDPPPQQIPHLSLSNTNTSLTIATPNNILFIIAICWFIRISINI